MPSKAILLFQSWCQIIDLQCKVTKKHKLLFVFGCICFKIMARKTKTQPLWQQFNNREVTKVTQSHSFPSHSIVTQVLYIWLHRNEVIITKVCATRAASAALERSSSSLPNGLYLRKVSAPSVGQTISLACNYF